MMPVPLSSGPLSEHSATATELDEGHGTDANTAAADDNYVAHNISVTNASESVNAETDNEVINGDNGGYSETDNDHGGDSEHSVFCF